MKIRQVRHRGIRRLLEDDDTRGVRPDLISRVRNILTALVSAADIDGVKGPPGWNVHRLSGDRPGTWSIRVSGNWRITFDCEGDDILNLDLEDYH
jgi:proteic killer suppression protein